MCLSIYTTQCHIHPYSNQTIKNTPGCSTFKFCSKIYEFMNFLLFSLQLCVCICVCSTVCSRKGWRSFGNSVRCVWQTACSSVGQTRPLIQAQSVIGIWIWANNNNVILTTSLGGYYSNWHNIISSDLVAFISHFSFFMIFGSEGTVLCWRGEGTRCD